MTLNTIQCHRGPQECPKRAALFSDLPSSPVTHSPRVLRSLGEAGSLHSVHESFALFHDLLRSSTLFYRGRGPAVLILILILISLLASSLLCAKSPRIRVHSCIR